MDKNEIIAIATTGLYGVFGSTTHYAYRIATKKEPQFKLAVFLINGLFGFYIGIAAGSFIPADWASRDGMLMVAGFLVYQIFDLIEERGIDYIKQRAGLKDERK